MPNRATWYPARIKARAAGRSISGGMIYLGHSEKRLAGMRPSTVDPALPAVDEGVDPESPPGLATRYEDMSPGQRWAYLNWLDSKRSTPLIHDHYLFAYLFGLEYRSREVTQLPDREPERRMAMKILMHQGQSLTAEAKRLEMAYAGRTAVVRLARSIAARLNEALAAIGAEIPDETDLVAKAIHWVPRGERVTLMDMPLKGGMFYVTERDDGQGSNEPSAIDLQHSAEEMPAHPVALPFRQLHQVRQKAYLSWIAGDHSSSQAQDWMIQLCLWGLERRVHIDLWRDNGRENGDELSAIERLLRAWLTRPHGPHHEPEWRKAATTLLAWIGALIVLQRQRLPDSLNNHALVLTYPVIAAIYDAHGIPWTFHVALRMLHHPNAKATPWAVTAYPEIYQRRLVRLYTPRNDGTPDEFRRPVPLVMEAAVSNPSLGGRITHTFPGLLVEASFDERLRKLHSLVHSIDEAFPEIPRELALENAGQLGATAQFLLTTRERKGMFTHDFASLCDSLRAKGTTREPLASLLSRVGGGVPQKSVRLLKQIGEAFAEQGIFTQPDLRGLNDPLPPGAVLEVIIPERERAPEPARPTTELAPEPLRTIQPRQIISVPPLARPKPPATAAKAPAPIVPARKRLNLDHGKIRQIQIETEKTDQLLRPIFEAQEEQVQPEPVSTHPWGISDELAQFMDELRQAAPLPLTEAERIADRYQLMLEGAIEALNDASLEYTGEMLLEIDGAIVTRIDPSATE